MAIKEQPRKIPDTMRCATCFWFVAGHPQGECRHTSQYQDRWPLDFCGDHTPRVAPKAA